MSFRWRLILGLGLTVLLTAAVYGLLGYLVFKQAVNEDIEKNFSEFQTAIQTSLDLTGERPVLIPREGVKEVLDKYNYGFQIVRDGQIELEGGRPLESGADWRNAALELDGGYRLELALNVAENRSALTSYLETALLAILLVLAVATLFSLSLQRFLLQPLKDLQRGVEQLSQHAIPKPVAVPAGNDELSHLALSFNRMTESLQAFLERERSFTRYASHELRTPLSNLRVLSEGVQKGILAPEPVWPQIDETLDRMEGILSGLLNLTRSPQLDPEPLAVQPAIRRTIAGLREQEKERVSLASAAPVYVMAQDDLLNRVLANLLHNALKYSSGEVTVDVQTFKHEVLITVRDFGPGVPEASLPRLSDPFFRLDTRKGGLGLGLALVKHIVQALGGTVSFKNAAPGLSAVVSLPKATLLEEPALVSTAEVAHV